MSDSLREQLLKAGFAPSHAQKREQRGKPQPSSDKPKPPPPQRQRHDEPDLARAYAIRAQTEKAERDAAQREAQQQAQERRERKRRLHELLQGQSLNLAEAEQVRHFEHAGKIRRIYVSAEQLAALNRGELGIVVHAGRFVLVPRDIALQASAIAEDVVALLVEHGDSRASEDGVPDDLMW